MARDKKYRKRRFGNTDRKTGPYCDHINLRFIDDLDDEGFAYIMDGVKGVNMLDLNETEITNKSIELLTGLEYVRELRLKGCHGLDDNCVDDLNKITSLELLHVKNTSVTINGLLKLHALTNLKTILFSADDVDPIKEKMLQLKTTHSACEFVVDGKPYYFEAIDRFIHAINTRPYTYRLKIKGESLDAAWSNWLTRPGNQYIEAAAQGPYSLNDIEWVEVNPVEKRATGRLMPEQEIDHSAEITRLLEMLSFPYTITNRVISFYILKKELQ